MNLLHLAMPLDMADIKLPGIKGRFSQVFRLLARIAYWLGKEKDFEKYYLNTDLENQPA